MHRRTSAHGRFRTTQLRQRRALMTVSRGVVAANVSDTANTALCILVRGRPFVFWIHMFIWICRGKQDVCIQVVSSLGTAVAS